MKYAIIVAAGNSTRYGEDKLNKQLLGKSVLQHSVDVFRAIADVVIVVGKRVDGTLCAEGGRTRFQSVLNGLQLIADSADGLVAIHDGARPFITRAFVEYLFFQAHSFDSAVPRLPVTDTIYHREYDPEFVKVDRNEYFTVQTPQVFNLSKLRHAVSLAKTEYTDESALYLDVYKEVHFVNGLSSNLKLTYKDDLPEFRVGVGFDVHPFTKGKGVILGGVTIPYDKKLLGHSDADALCHAICDAILSASSNLDIGHQFPDTDDKYRGADSTQLLAQCVLIAHNSGYEVVNVSAVIICQEPKISPHIGKIASRLAEILHVAPSCVNLSATTTEHLGALGNGDGIAVSAQTLLRRL